MSDDDESVMVRFGRPAPKAAPSTIDIRHLEGWVAVRRDGQLELLDSDYYAEEVAAGRILPGSSYQ